MAQKTKDPALIPESAKFPTDPPSRELLENQIKIGELGDLSGILFPFKPRYLVTYMNSQTAGRIRSATVVSVTNQARTVNTVTVSFYKGLGSSPVGTCTYRIPPGYTIDFCTRRLPNEITTCNCVPKSELTFDEGRAIVSSSYAQIGVSARVIYTQGKDDDELLAISDSKVVVFGKGNIGD